MKRINIGMGFSSIAMLAFTAIGVGCTDSEDVINATYNMPTGLAIAGTVSDRLFIVNTGDDSVQVIEMGEGLETLNPVEGPSYYFPLRIPGGPAPEEIAASENGRFVVVLNWITEKLHVIDADSLNLAKQDGIPVEISLGDSGNNPYRVLSVPQGCARSTSDGCAGAFLVSFPESGVVVEVLLDETGSLVTGSVTSTYAIDGSPGELAVSSDGQFAYAADTLTGHFHRINLEVASVDKFETGTRVTSLGLSSDNRYLILGRSSTQDVLVLDGATSDVPVQVLGNTTFAPSVECLPNCENDASPEEQCPGAHPADLSICSGPNGIERAVGQTYDGVYLGFIPASFTAVGVGAGMPSVTVPCESIADEPLEQIWSEVMVVLGQNGEGYFLGLTLESGEDTVPTILSRGWCKSGSLSDIAVDTYNETSASLANTASAENADDGLNEPLVFKDVFADCLGVPDGMNRFDCIRFPDSDAGAVINPMRSRVLLMGYQWEPVIQLGEASSLLFERPITGGIYNYENEVATFGDAGLSIGTFAPYFKTRRQLIESGDCSEDSVNCGDILEITSPIGNQLIVGAPIDPNTDLDACADALAGEPELNCSLERRIIDTISVDGTTELVLDRPLPEACMPSSGKIAYRVRMGDVYGINFEGYSQKRMSPGDAMGLGGEILPTGSVRAQIRPDDMDVRSLSACDRYGVDGALIDGRYRRDAAGAVRIADRHVETLSDNSVVGLVWTMLLTTAGDPLSTAGAPMLLGQTTLWSRSEALPVIFTSYARSNRLVGMVPYPYEANPEDSLDADADFLSPGWRSSSTHFKELN